MKSQPRNYGTWPGRNLSTKSLPYASLVEAVTSPSRFKEEESQRIFGCSFEIATLVFKYIYKIPVSNV